MPKIDKNRVLGYVHFDTPGASNRTCEFLTEQSTVHKVARNKYVKALAEDGGCFLGRIVEGPFFIPEELGRNSAFTQTAILKGGEFPAVPNYYSVARLEILGELVGNDLVSTNTRPLPKSAVVELTSEEVQDLIRVKGDIHLGRLLGYEEVEVLLDARSKKVLPRNVGIFGTVGSGKTNTAQVLIEDASAAGYAVIVFDVEGEYINMDSPTQELKAKLAQFGLKPKGLRKFAVYYPSGGDKLRLEAIPFDVNFGGFDKYVLAELMELSEPQDRVWMHLISKLTEQEEERRKAKTSKKRKANEEISPRETDSYPSEAMRFLQGSEFEGGTYTIGQAIGVLFGDVMQELKGFERQSAYILAKKMWRVRRQKIFDEIGQPIKISKLLKPQHVSVIDVSTIGTDAKNIVIASVLRRVFEAKLDRSKELPPTLILVEEAHTFISREARDRMEATMDILKVIARRGRKRWLCLGFVSQQPSHLPPEIFELCNTRIIHCTKSSHNISPIKRTTGGILDEIWDAVPALSAGQALVVSPQFNHPVVVDVRPSRTKRELVD